MQRKRKLKRLVSGGAQDDAYAEGSDDDLASFAHGDLQEMAGCGLNRRESAQSDLLRLGPREGLCAGIEGALQRSQSLGASHKRRQGPSDEGASGAAAGSAPRQLQLPQLSHLQAGVLHARSLPRGGLPSHAHNEGQLAQGEVALTTLPARQTAAGKHCQSCFETL